MFGLTNGELFVVGFIFVVIVSATWWPRAGAALGQALAGEPRPKTPPADPSDS